MLTDLEHKRRAIELAKEDVAGGHGVPSSDAVHPLVRDSWQRCGPRFRFGGPDAAPVDAADSVRDRWHVSPLRRAVPELVTQLEAIALSGDLIACISDADGRVLWQTTPGWLRPGAERIGLQPGGVWHEQTSGTNGIGLALTADQPVTVFATEHLLNPVHDWVCYAAPVHDPDGTQIGAIDLSTTWTHANPLAIVTVTSIARLVEHELALHQSGAGAPATTLMLRVLGSPAATLGRQPLRLTQRQFEILTILAASGQATLGELHAQLYGDRPVSVATLKSEMSRLRRLLQGALASRPYRLTLPVRVDAVRLLERLAAGDVDGAAGLYAGQLLATSEAPAIIDYRHHVDVALRTALLMRGAVSAALRYGAVHPYDVEVLERARSRAAVDDPLVPALTARLSLASSG